MNMALAFAWLCMLEWIEDIGFVILNSWYNKEKILYLWAILTTLWVLLYKSTTYEKDYKICMILQS